jgi:hypothetical protein
MLFSTLTHSAGRPEAYRVREMRVPYAFALVVALLVLSGCSSSHHARGSIVGRLVPGGMQPEGTYTEGTVRVIAAGHLAATVNAEPRRRGFFVRLRPDSYVLKAQYLGEPCIGKAHVRSRVTATANVICSTKSVRQGAEVGAIVGAIHAEGGPAVPRNAKVPGVATLYNGSGRVIGREHITKGHDFRFTLAPGRYRVGGVGCPSHGARVLAGHTTHANVGTYCGVP